MGKFDRVESLVNPETEHQLMSALEPNVAAAYEAHMTTGARKQRGDDPVQDTVGTIDPLQEVYRSVGLEPQHIITPELVDAVGTSHREHINKFLEQGVDLREPIRRAGQMNLGTENNLVWYHGKQYSHFKDQPEFTRMLSRWTAEEADHGPLIELWGMLSGAISPAEAHQIKVALMMGGISVYTDSFAALNAFTDPQEFDTGDAHTNYGKILDAPGRVCMNKIGGHEFRHGRLFAELGKAMYSLDQKFIDYALSIEVETHRRFGMPTEGSYPNFGDEAMMIAVYGLFTTEGVVARQRERVERLGLLDIEVTTEEAKKAQAKLADIIDIDSKLNSIRVRAVEKATNEYIKAEKAAGRVPAILGRTLIYKSGGELVVHPDAA